MTRERASIMRGERGSIMRMSISQPNQMGLMNLAGGAGAGGNPSLGGMVVNKSSFIPNLTGNVHEHNHRMTPHMHETTCDRFVSGIDKNRQSRFYFTKMPTPIRVYLNYSEKLVSAPTGIIDPASGNLGTNEQINPVLNGRKLSPKTLRSQLKVSPHFIDDAKNYIFNKETLSLVPILPTINLAASNNTLTMAEMATQPLNLPPISQQPHHHYNKSKQNSRLTSIKPRKMTETSITSSNNFDRFEEINE